MPFGGVREDVGSITQTDFGYTGQRQLDEGMGGLMDYKARFYSPTLGRFIQPDTIIPNAGSSQAFNRYAYVNNSPINYTDPTGHRCIEREECYEEKPRQPLIIFAEDEGQNWTNEEKDVINQGAGAVGAAFAQTINREKFLLWKSGEIERYDPITVRGAFFKIFGGPIVVRRSGSDCDCWAQHMNKQDGQHYEIWVYSTTSTAELISHPYLIVHEIGHAFSAAVGGQPAYSVPGSLFRPVNSEGIIGTDADDRSFYGYSGPHFQWQFGTTAGYAQRGEEFADMFLGWVYGKWEDSSMGINRQNFMNPLMVSYLFP